MSRSSEPAGYRGLRVLVAGAGVAALEAVFALRALAGDLVDIELLAPEPRFFYRPQAVLEPFGGLRVQAFELSEIAAAVGAQLTAGELASVAPASHVARTTSGMEIEYGVLLLAPGASPRAVLQDAVTFRGPADSDRIAALGRAAARGDIEHLTMAVPVRRTWPLPLYELAFGLRGVTATTPITVATVEPAPAAVLGTAGSERVSSLLESRHVAVAVGYDFDCQLRRGVTVAAPELVASRIYGVPADEGGFIPVDRFGAVAGLADVYAAGDATSYEVKHGSLAAAQADAAALAIAARAGADVVQVPFRPVLHARLALGEESIFVRRNVDDPLDPGVVSSDPLWSPAAKIFAKYLGPALSDLAARRGYERSE